MILSVSFGLGIYALSRLVKRWESEHLSYPIAEAVKQAGSVNFADPYLWAGASLAFILKLGKLSRGAALSIPRLGWAFFAFNPTLGALACFMPNSLLSGCFWVFWLLRPVYALPLFMDYSGLTLGAYLAYAGKSLFILRPLQVALGVICAVAGVWHLKTPNFVPWGFVAPSAAILLCHVLGLVYARLRAETGLPGSLAYPWEACSVFGKYNFLIRGYWAALYPALVDSLRLLGRKTWPILWTCIVISIGLGMVWQLHLAYKYGANLLETGYTGGSAWVHMAYYPFHGPVRWGSVALGTGLTALLFLLNRVWFGCPLHPASVLFSVAESGTLWFPLTCAWLIKKAAQYLGGWRALRRLQSLAIGILLVEFLSQLYSMILSRR